ncbi:MAG: competence/damage-inducible protein A [Clostridiales bacterium]|nr:competence/damage-inducible protein A [Clostridiales bacterium]
MKTAILSVGTEILFGQIVNTNTVYLSQQLNLLGFDVMYHYTVGDNTSRLKEMIEYIFHDCDLILTTGGLGPTQDDLTKETICEAMGDVLVENAEELAYLKSQWKGDREMPSNNIKQAWFPSRATILKNPIGTAPGFALENNGKMVISMPGPPREMTRMFENEVKPLLEKMQDSVIHYRTIRTSGIGESDIEMMVLDLIEQQTDPTIAPYAKDTGTQIRVASKRKTLEEAKAAVDEMVDVLAERMKEYVYSTDDEELVDVVAKKLIDRNLTIASAESCTAGLFASTLAEVPGISQALQRAFVTYSNESKVQELGVKPETLEKYGAVSVQTAEEMATGLYNKSGADICVSVTGIAGPDGGSDEKPVGMVCFGFNYNSAISGGDGSRVVKTIEMRRKDYGRNYNRKFASHRMLLNVNRILDDKELIK